MLLPYQFLPLQNLHEIFHHDSISLFRWMDAIILVILCLQCDSLEEEVHIVEVILFCEFREDGFIAFSIFTSEIEWCLHPREEDGYIFSLEFFYDGSDIGLYLGRVFSLEGIIGTDTEDDESQPPCTPLIRGAKTLKYPIKTREESCGRISGYSSVYDFIIISLLSKLDFELARIGVFYRKSKTDCEGVTEGEDSMNRGFFLILEDSLLIGRTRQEKQRNKEEEYSQDHIRKRKSSVY